MKQKKQKGRFLGMSLGTLDASLLENLLTSKGKIKAGHGTFRAGESTVRTGQDFSKFWNTKLLSKRT